MRLVFDTETDGLIDVVSKIHCICAEDLDTGESYAFRPDEIDAGLDLLSSADELWAHNLWYDVPALEKVTGWAPRKRTTLRCSLVVAKLCFSDREDADFSDPRSRINALQGSHSLKAWGIRLGVYKGDYGEKEDAWEEFSEEMLEYCIQDVRVGKKLVQYLIPRMPKRSAVELEMAVAAYAEACNRRGWKFNVNKAEVLLHQLVDRQAELRKELQRLFPGHQEVMKTPAYWKLMLPDGSVHTRPTKGEVDRLRKDLKLKPKDCRIEQGPMKVKVHEFNPNSTKQVAAKLYERYQWLSPELTDKGQELLDAGEGTFEELIHEYAQIKEDTLETLPYPEAPTLVEYKMLTKRISMLSTGTSAWLKLVSPDGRMRYRLNSIGTITHRASHSRPNLSQVTGAGKPWGAECRALFEASDGRKVVGADLSGIEARLLGHYLHPYDKGAFCDLVLNGDFHQHNADTTGLARKDAKTLIYGYMYGAGDVKIGMTVVASSDEWKSYYNTVFQTECRKHPPNKASQRAYRKIGKIIRGRLEEGITGLPDLISDVQTAAERGYLSPLDGRRLPVRSPHSALNTLLQGSAGIVAKRWLTYTFDTSRREKVDAHMLIFSHDEIQADTLESHVEPYKRIVLGSIKRVEKYYKIKIQLDGEAKVGDNWYDTH